MKQPPPAKDLGLLEDHQDLDEDQTYLLALGTNPAIGTIARVSGEQQSKLSVAMAANRSTSMYAGLSAYIQHAPNEAPLHHRFP